MRRLTVPLALTLVACTPMQNPNVPALSGTTPNTPGTPATTASPLLTPSLKMFVLPGGLDTIPVLHSNSPEVLKSDGVLVSTLAGTGANLDYSFDGDFEVFSHHFADQPTFSLNDGCWLGLLARNPGTTPVTVKLTAGASWLSRPDAPYIELASVLDDPTGIHFAGPGSRVATDFVQQRSPIAPETYTLAPGETRALQVLPMPTTNRGLPNRNGRSGLFRFTASGPIRLAEVAKFGRMSTKPDTAALKAVWDAGLLATPRDNPPTDYDPASPPTSGAFRYGRVAGVAVGARWTGTLFAQASALLTAAGERIGFPIATVVLNTVGTHQVQAPSMAKRYPDTAVQAHGGYGVAYALALPLDNPDATPRRYTVALVSPMKVDEQHPGPPVFQASTAGRGVTFRGPVRLDWTDEAGQAQHSEAHVVLHQGEDAKPFVTVTVPAGKRYDATLSLVYAADCTPPQVVAVGRL